MVKILHVEQAARIPYIEYTPNFLPLDVVPTRYSRHVNKLQPMRPRANKHKNSPILAIVRIL